MNAIVVFALGVLYVWFTLFIWSLCAAAGWADAQREGRRPR